MVLGISQRGVNNLIAESNGRIKKDVAKIQQTGEDVIHQFIVVMVVDVSIVSAVLMVGFILLVRLLVIKPTRETTERIRGLAAGGGDLTIRLPVNQKDEIGELRHVVNEFIGELHTIVTAIVTDVEQLATQQANHGRDLATEVENAPEVIKQLAQNSNDIGSIIDVIKGVAEQTNLLALNAAIEAARAGEQGRGFAVVADEVRILASRTQDSTQEIHDMIERIQSSANNAVSAMDTGCGQAQKTMDKATEADSALQEIGHTIESINNMNSQIATAAIQQSTVAEEINVNIDNINASCEKTAAGATQVAAAEQLSKLSNHLQNLTAQFKV
ncbi:MAG: HAMP domain-containing methyl-accepting chemotaxis protein [Gammaproteobacteria bacterium]